MAICIVIKSYMLNLPKATLIARHKYTGTFGVNKSEN